MRLHLSNLAGLARRLPSPSLGSLRYLMGKYVSPSTFGLRYAFRYSGRFCCKTLEVILG